MADEPLFDSSRRAVVFALNYRTGTARPVMNKMADFERTRKLELADGTRIEVVVVKNYRPRSSELTGQDGAGTAGMILQMLLGIPDAQQLAVMAGAMVPLLPCSCRAPCCAGQRPNPDWMRVALRICEHLKEEAQLSKIPGKKGMSTSPQLRFALVERFFVPRLETTVEQMAQKCDVSANTVAAHRRPIVNYLTRQQDEGWTAMDELLAGSGIVGTQS